MLATHVLALESRGSPHPRMAERPREILVDEPRHVLDRLPPPQSERVAPVGRTAGCLRVDPHDAEVAEEPRPDLTESRAADGGRGQGGKANRAQLQERP